MLHGLASIDCLFFPHFYAFWAYPRLLVFFCYLFGTFSLGYDLRKMIKKKILLPFGISLAKKGRTTRTYFINNALLKKKIGMPKLTFTGRVYSFIAIYYYQQRL